MDEELVLYGNGEVIRFKVIDKEPGPGREETLIVVEKPMEELPS